MPGNDSAELPATGMRAFLKPDVYRVRHSSETLTFVAASSTCVGSTTFVPSVQGQSTHSRMISNRR